MVNFSEWLKAELKKRNLLQKELAGMMNVSEGIVSRYISGKDVPSPINLIKIAKVFGLPEKEVLEIGGYDEQYRKIRTAEVTVKSDGHGEKIEFTDTLDKKLYELCSRFNNVFLDKRGKLDKKSKEVLIYILEDVIKKEEQEP